MISNEDEMTPGEKLRASLSEEEIHLEEEAAREIDCPECGMETDSDEDDEYCRDPECGWIRNWGDFWEIAAELEAWDNQGTADAPTGASHEAAPAERRDRIISDLAEQSRQ